MAVLPQYQYQVGTPNQYLSPDQQQRLTSPYWTGQQQSPYMVPYLAQPALQTPPQQMPNNHVGGPLLGQPGPRPPMQQPTPTPRLATQQAGTGGMGNARPTPVMGQGVPTAPPRNNYQNFGNPYQPAPAPNQMSAGPQQPLGMPQRGVGGNGQGFGGSFQKPVGPTWAQQNLGIQRTPFIPMPNLRPQRTLY